MHLREAKLLLLGVCALTLALMAAGVARAQPADAQEETVELPEGEPLDLTTPLPEPGSARAKTLNLPSIKQQSDLNAKVGVDYRKPAIPAMEFKPDQLLAGTVSDQSPGVAWANITAGELPLGWDKASVDTRLDPSQDQGKVGTTLSRSVPFGDNMAVTLQNGVSVSRTLPSTTQAAAQSWSSSQALRFNILPTDTTLSVGADLSSTDDKWLRSLGAEQKLFGGPFSVSGAMSETANGDLSKSLRAGFKRTW